MAEHTSIEWTHHTFNPWIGCTAVSCACDHCYAEKLVERWGGDFSIRRRTSAANWRLPLRWNKAAEAAGVRRRVFCASLADVFDNQVPEEWRHELWELIGRTRWLDWQLLTKRPQNISKMLPVMNSSLPGYRPWNERWPWRNVWLGTTVENQTEANRRIPHLLAVPARVHFLSCEPLLGPVDLRALDVDGHSEMDALRPSSWREVWEGDWSPAATGLPLEQCIHDYTEDGGVYPPTDARPAGIDWVIAGGESGPGARPMHPDWARSLHDQCQAAAVPFFFKQWGEFAPHLGGGDGMPDSFSGKEEIFWPDFSTSLRVGKKLAGDLLDGVQHHEFPA